MVRSPVRILRHSSRRHMIRLVLFIALLAPASVVPLLEPVPPGVSSPIGAEELGHGESSALYDDAKTQRGKPAAHSRRSWPDRYDGATARQCAPARSRAAERGRQFPHRAAVRAGRGVHRKAQRAEGSRDPLHDELRREPHLSHRTGRARHRWWPRRGRSRTALPSRHSIRRSSVRSLSTFPQGTCPTRLRRSSSSRTSGGSSRRTRLRVRTESRGPTSRSCR